MNSKLLDDTCSSEHLEFEFDTFEEAMDIHTKMFKILKDKNRLSYSDVLKLIHGEKYKTKNCYKLYGWVNLFETQIKPRTKFDKTTWVIEVPDLIKIR